MLNIHDIHSKIILIYTNRMGVYAHAHTYCILKYSGYNGFWGFKIENSF